MRPISGFDKYLWKVICANGGAFLQKWTFRPFVWLKPGVHTYDFAPIHRLRALKLGHASLATVFRPGRLTLQPILWENLESPVLRYQPITTAVVTDACLNTRWHHGAYTSAVLRESLGLDRVVTVYAELSRPDWLATAQAGRKQVQSRVCTPSFRQQTTTHDRRNETKQPRTTTPTDCTINCRHVRATRRRQRGMCRRDVSAFCTQSMRTMLNSYVSPRQGGCLEYNNQEPRTRTPMPVLFLLTLELPPIWLYCFEMYPWNMNAKQVNFNLPFSLVELWGNLAVNVPQWVLIDLISRAHVESESEGCQAGTLGRFSEIDDLCGTGYTFFQLNMKI